MQTKSKTQIKLVKESCRVLVEVKKVVKGFVKPGVTPLDLDKIAYQKIRELKAKPAFLHYQGFPNSLCVSVNEQLIHGVPNNVPLAEGDVVSVDCGVKWKGYNSDSAFTVGVGKISKRDEQLIKTAEEAFFVGLNQVKPKARIGDVEFAIGSFIRKKGYFTPRNFSGHGIGKKLHEEPNIFNFGTKGTGPIIKDGMILCIEPMILQGSKETFCLEDGWTVVAKSKLNASHYEHTILIENGYPKVLT